MLDARTPLLTIKELQAWYLGLDTPAQELLRAEVVQNWIATAGHSD